MTSRARRIPDSLLECYLAEALEEDAKARLELILDSSPEDRARLEELRMDSLEFSRRHSLAPLLSRVQAEWERSFTESERAFLERLAPLMKSLVRNWRLLDHLGTRASVLNVLDELLRRQGLEYVVLSSSGAELQRSAGVTALVESWFAREERVTPQGPPAPLLEWLELLVSRRPVGAEPSLTWHREGLEKNLRVRFVPLHEQGGQRLWAMMFQEVAIWVTVPASWRELLTQRELRVAECVLRGWENQRISGHLNCSVTTLKVHLRRVFGKLGVDSRAALIHKATHSSDEGSMARPRKLAVPSSTTALPPALASWAETIADAIGRGHARALNNSGIGGVGAGQAASNRRRGQPPKMVAGDPVPPERMCKEAGCAREARAKGLCSAHYQAERRRLLAVASKSA